MPKITLQTSARPQGDGGDDDDDDSYHLLRQFCDVRIMIRSLRFGEVD